MALSGLDLALWDIRAKAAGWPLYKLLGGASKPIKAYAGGISLGWQPPQSLGDEAALDWLRRLPDVPAVHVFSWWPGDTRLRLRERGDLWRAAFEIFTRGDALLEFVPGDDPALVAEEAEACRALLSS